MHTPIFDALRPLATRLAAEREATRHTESQEKPATSHGFLHRLGVFNGLDPEELTSRLPRVADQLGSSGVHRLSPPRLIPSTRAWDLMRVEDFLGEAMIGGWLSAQEDRDFAQRAAHQLQDPSTHWSHAATSFWWGHQVWLASGGQGPRSPQGLNILLTTAPTHPNSPWLKAPMHR